ncbi:UNVERIFIED_CONTAM: hypothetical protein Slati_0970600 [Sesamum latifolium]|uniref:Uncharacterized protein n=1 Tax=Sesamum latifolium TaxID=2727402 RepID=A0AAW2XT54_9LAMI
MHKARDQSLERFFQIFAGVRDAGSDTTSGNQTLQWKTSKVFLSQTIKEKWKFQRTLTYTAE